MNLERIRKTVTQNVGDELDGLSLKDGIKWLLDHQNNFGEDAKFELDYDYSNTRLLITWTEPETDKEYERRLQAHEKSKANRRKQYEELKKEFESKE